MRTVVLAVFVLQSLLVVHGEVQVAGSTRHIELHRDEAVMEAGLTRARDAVQANETSTDPGQPTHACGACQYCCGHVCAGAGSKCCFHSGGNWIACAAGLGCCDTYGNCAVSR